MWLEHDRLASARRMMSEGPGIVGQVESLYRDVGRLTLVALGFSANSCVIIEVVRAVQRIRIERLRRPRTSKSRGRWWCVETSRIHSGSSKSLEVVIYCR